MSYLLGCSDLEVQRLTRQHEVWREDTEEFIRRLGVEADQRVLELGCGIGLTLPYLAERVGVHGHVIAMDSSSRYVAHARRAVADRQLGNAQVIESDVCNDPLPAGPFDVIFARWLFSLIPDVSALLERVRHLLAPDGVVGILDYNHDGKRLHPPAPAFERVNRAMVDMYIQHGGNPWVSCELPGALHECGYRCEDVWSYHKVGLPGSAVYQWIQMFADSQGPQLVDRGMLDAGEWQAYLDERAAYCENPATIIFSPILVGVKGRYRGRADR